ncbi:MAG: GAF domain-containing protein [Prevotella sp.]|nr:GAF domain-containing protein [Prevotella sp.]
MDRKERYRVLVSQIESLISGETDETGILANVSAAMKEAFPERFFWVGFYLVRNGVLRLGPFQGSVACYEIPFGKGVCGTAWKEGKTIIVDDVETFPGHIACSSLSRSEIVVPIRRHNGEIVGVIDIDSKNLADFNQDDGKYLEQIAALLTDNLYA